MMQGVIGGTLGRALHRGGSRLRIDASLYRRNGNNDFHHRLLLARDTGALHPRHLNGVVNGDGEGGGGNDKKVKDEQMKKKYVLAMFPYPSGKLHMGHTRVYTYTDVLSRMYRMMGVEKVIQPMGWDAFGLPAENAAIDNGGGISPAKWTEQNILLMKQQLSSLDYAIDWDREINTSSPEYYRWTQWLFVQMFKRGLAYQSEAVVNWDPIDMTVLANEQVDSEGRSWRSGAVVERKKLKQWFFNIRQYADELHNGLNNLKDWPEQVKTMQRQWIGRSEGAMFNFVVHGAESPEANVTKTLCVFTTRPDTMYGVTYVAVAPEHEIVQSTSDDQREQVSEFVKRITSQSSIKRNEGATQSKDGVYLGVDVIHPLTREKLPVFVAEYVIADFAEGCVMGVPAHDARDFAFAKRHEIDVKCVIQPPGKGKVEECYTGKEGILFNSGEFNGRSVADAQRAITAHAQKENVGKSVIQYRLRDWLVSRQRYWGAPIPIIHCPQCGPVAVPESDLPVVLPTDVELTGRGGSPLTQNEDWINVKCPCGKGVNCKRDTDTMDTFVDSSWYFLRYTDPNNSEHIVDPSKSKKEMNVDVYIGGIEHAVLHLLYARFIHKFTRDLDFVDHDEPFEKLLTQGLVQAEAVKDPDTGRYYKREEFEKREDGTVIDKETQKPLKVAMEKMSKSKHNGLDPMQYVKTYGSDVVRLYSLFKAPLEKDLEWDDEQISGQQRFLSRAETLIQEFIYKEKQRKSKESRLHVLEKARANTWEQYQLQSEVMNHIESIKKGITETQTFNVCVAELHKLVNMLQSCKDDLKDTEVFAQAMLLLPIVLAPFTPSFADKQWKIMMLDVLPTDESVPVSVHSMCYPSRSTHIPKDVVATYSKDEMRIITLAVQVQGKMKGTLQVPASRVTEEEIVDVVCESDLADRAFGSSHRKEDLKSNIKRIIIPKNGRLVNFVMSKTNK